LLGAVNYNQTIEIVQRQILAQNSMRGFERETMTVADFLMDDEANVQTKWFAGIGHESLQTCRRG
jgi:hypothetical protein